jgi:protein TonB
MATMNGVLFTRPPDGSEDREPSDELFTGSLVVSDPHFEKRGIGRWVSVGLHVVILLAVVLLPIFWPEALPDQRDYVRALFFNPPPPPPPPPPRGSSSAPKVEVAKPTTPDLTPRKPEFTQPETPKDETPLKPEDKAPETQQFGSETGSDTGVEGGLEGGVEGGVVGGVFGGVLGGCVGCTGDGPVLNPEQNPRPIKLTKPLYPQEAFIKKIEGIVELEILIDATGRVVHARVVKSIPQLDQAAIQTVHQWLFSPAVHKGRPVASWARAPVTFRIF